ncbi:MAG TPA: prephenate dehydratase [Candidatus Dormibacteraeota bacterium]|nr:prephenate dehydratase [Candidatus Dormibacteraeota bacterium]
MSPRGGAVAYQGEAGAYSDEAAQVVRPGLRTIGHETFALAFRSLIDRKVEAAVLPVENSLAGIVQEVNDLLWDFRLLTVVGEHVHPVRHCLLGYGEPVKRAISHPQALAQCRRWLAEHEIEAVPFMDTAGAARQVAESHVRGLGAIASRSAAKRYGLQVLFEGIQDDPSNRTRFLVIERGIPTRPEAAAPNSKASLAFIAAHRPGSLVEALQAFSKRGVNLSRLDSRPLRDRPFEYLFYVDFEVGDPEAAGEALADLEGQANELRYFGAYPAAIAPAG